MSQPPPGRADLPLAFATNSPGPDAYDFMIDAVLLTLAASQAG